MNTAYHRIKSPAMLAFTCLLLCLPSGLAVKAEGDHPKIVCRAELASKRRLEMTEQLRSITGWTGLHFDAEGAMQFGAAQPVGGSPSARALLVAAQSGKNLIVLEDASGRADVVFCRVTRGLWKKNDGELPPAFIVQIDFKDFSHVQGDEAARAAFNAGWGVLHEIAHVVQDADDTERAGEVGEGERLINLMRRECGMAERAEYFYTLLPGLESTEFNARFARLAFEERKPNTKRKHRYWLIWDTRIVGGGDVETARQLTRMR